MVEKIRRGSTIISTGEVNGEIVNGGYGKIYVFGKKSKVGATTDRKLT